MATTTATNNFLMRLIGSAALDRAVYEEIEADPRAGTQAALVVVLSSLCTGIGSRGFGNNGVANIILFAIIALMAWACWAFVVFEIGARLLPEPQTVVDIGQLMRTIGFAATPGLVHGFGFIPGVTRPAFVLGSVWTLLAMIVAVRQALDYRSTGRAVLVCLLGWALALVVAFVLGVIFAPVVY
jgi:hypothetical protein